MTISSLEFQRLRNSIVTHSSLRHDDLALRIDLISVETFETGSEALVTVNGLKRRTLLCCSFTTAFTHTERIPEFQIDGPSTFRGTGAKLYIYNVASLQTSGSLNAPLLKNAN